jgi:hypothetical protein
MIKVYSINYSNISIVSHSHFADAKMTDLANAWDFLPIDLFLTLEM